MSETAPRLRLPPRQQAVVDTILEYTATHGYAPSVRDIGDALGISSENGVYEHIRALKRKGVIASSAGVARSLRVVVATTAGPGALRELTDDALLLRWTTLHGRTELLDQQTLATESAYLDAQSEVRRRGLRVEEVGGSAVLVEAKRVPVPPFVRAHVTGVERRG